MPNKLLRVLGLAFGWSITIGATIGAGILRAPGEIAQNVPSYPAFFAIWVAGGAFALLGALSLAELGTMIPRSGGQTVFVRRAFGEFPGFAVAWSDWISSCASVAVITIVLMDAAVVLAPALVPYQSSVAALIILAFAAIQWRGVREGSVTQIATSMLKAAAFSALIIACFVVTRPEMNAPIAQTTGLTLVGIVIALQAMVYTYDGWAGVLYFSGEIENPGRDIPRSMMTGVISVTVIYLLVNFAFLRIVPLERAAGDPMLADTVAQAIFGPAGTSIIRILIAISLLSAINGCLLQASRVAYAVGIAKVNPGGTPWAALAISTAVSLGFVVTGTFNQVAAIAAFFFIANYAMSFASVFRLRRTEGDTARPYKAWGFPVTTGIVLLCAIAFLIAVVISDPRNGVYAILLLAGSYPVYLIRKRTIPTPSKENS